MAVTVVAEDTPLIVLALADDLGNPVDVSDGLTVVVLRVLAVDSPGPAQELVCSKLQGVISQGQLVTTGQWAVAGRGGRVQAQVLSSTFPEAGRYEAEVQIEFGAVSQRLTSQKKLQITARKEL